MRTFIFILFFVSSVGFYNACSPKAEKVDSEKAKLEAAEHDFDKAYEKFCLAQKRLIKENESMISTLKSQKNRIAAPEKANREKTISDLEKKNQFLKDRLKGYTYKGLNDWEAFKKEFAAEIDALNIALKEMNR